MCPMAEANRRPIHGSEDDPRDTTGNVGNELNSGRKRSVGGGSNPSHQVPHHKWDTSKDQVLRIGSNGAVEGYGKFNTCECSFNIPVWDPSSSLA